MASRYVKREAAKGFQPELMPLWVSTYMSLIRNYLPQTLLHDLNRMFLENYAKESKRMRDDIARSSAGYLGLLNVHLAMYFFKMASIRGELDAADAHARALALSSEVVDPEAEQLFQIQLMWLDAGAATAAMRRTCLRQRQQVVPSVQRFWAIAEPQLPKTLGWDDIPACVQQADIRDAMGLVRRALLLIGDVAILGRLRQSSDLQDMVYGFVATKVGSARGALIDLYLDFVEHVVEGMSPARRYTEAVMALVMLHIYGNQFAGCWIDGKDLMDCSEIVLPRAEAALRTAMAVATKDEETKYKAVWLWACFVAAHHRAGSRSGSTEKSCQQNDAFLGLFEALLEKIGISTWDEVEEVLRKFVFVDYLEPNPRAWFETTRTHIHAS